MAAEQPLLQQIQMEKAANLAKAQNQMGYARAAAAIMQQAAPAIGNAYSNAANATAGYAQGLGQQVQNQINQNQTSNNQFLQQMGTPAAAIHPAAPVGNIAYGLQGFIPASTLQQEGAGWEAAAQAMPSDLLTEGQQAAQSTMQNDPTLVKLQGDLAKVASTQPAAYQKLLTAYQDQAYKQSQLGMDAARLQQGQEHIQIEAQRAQQSSAEAWARIGISQQHEQLMVAENAFKLAHGGFTQADLGKFKLKANAMANELYSGTTRYHLVGGVETPVHTGGVSYNEALGAIMKEGIPVQIALAQLDHVYPKKYQPTAQALEHVLGSLTPKNIQAQVAGQTLLPQVIGSGGVATGQGAKYQAQANRMAAGMGWGDTNNLQALYLLWNRESGWNPTARNPQSGALGIPQELGHTVPKDYATNPTTQITWGLNYIKQRYGSPLAAWQHEQQFGWY